jgi:hypothetical protein
MRFITRAMGWGSMLALAACSGGTTVPAGSERGPCYGNGTCDAPLVCLSNLCVRPTSDGGAADSGATDAGTGMDGGGVDAAIAPDAGPPERRTYVASSITVPSNASETNMLALDLDGDGAGDNALGQVFAALASAGAGAGTNAMTQAAVTDGDILLLFEANAASFTDGTADARALEGADPTPAPCTDPSMPSTCGQHLLGTGHFTVVAPAPAPLPAAITAGRLAVGPGVSALPLALSSTPAWLPIVAAHIQADVGASGWMHGIFAGAIRSADIDAVFEPAMLAAVTEAVAADCTAGSCTSGSAGATYLGLFDGDHDGMVTLVELQTNSLIQSLLQPDLDLFDASGAAGTDGVMDAMSVGIGFTAVAATFDAP